LYFVCLFVCPCVCLCACVSVCVVHIKYVRWYKTLRRYCWCCILCLCMSLCLCVCLSVWCIYTIKAVMFVRLFVCLYLCSVWRAKRLGRSRPNLTHALMSTLGVFVARSLSRSFMYACGSDRSTKHPARSDTWRTITKLRPEDV